MRKPSVLVVFLTVFIDLIGFGIVVPMVPLFGRHFGANGLTNGIIFASFSAMQFIFAPIWGRLSDRIGRRPVLLGSTAGAALSYVMFALAATLADHTTALIMMGVSRAFAGICGANITVAQAYIADITSRENRSKRMGLIGMAFGLGFIFGPLIGGLGLKYLGYAGPGWLAAGLCAANFILAFIILTESHTPSSEHVAPRPHLDQWGHTLRQPKIGLLVVTFFLATFCFSCFESTLALLVSDNFNLNLQSDEANSAAPVIFLFAYCGIIGAFVQGGLIGRMVKKMGEPRLIGFSLILTAISMAMLPYIKGTAQLSGHILFQHEGLPWVSMLFALALLSVGTNLTRPPLFGLLSNLTPANEQGATIGVAQGAGSLARILGPLFALPLLPVMPSLPYLTCTVVLIATGALVFQRLSSEKPAVAAVPAVPVE